MTESWCAVPVDNDRRATTVRLTKAGREQFAGDGGKPRRPGSTAFSTASMSPRKQHLSDQLEWRPQEYQGKED
jgi:hypothetical protein